MLSTTFIHTLFLGLDAALTQTHELNSLTFGTTYESHTLNLLSPNIGLSNYSLWYLTHCFSDSNLLWSVFFDELLLFNSYDISFIEFFVSGVNSAFDFDVLYSDLPDYLYIYNSFIFDWSKKAFPFIDTTVRFLEDNEDMVVIPTIIINSTVMALYVFIFASFFFSFYGKANSFDSLIDHDYLLASSTVEAEEEITSWDDMIIGLVTLTFIFMWYFGINLLMVVFHSPEYYLSLYIFPVLYYIIMLIPAFLAYDFGIYFIAYLRGTGNATNSVVELMYDYIAFASFYIRLVVQNVRLLLMTFTFASFHEIILIHEINRIFLLGDESIVDAWMKDTISFPSMCFTLVCNISTHIVYYFYELLHLLFVVTAQIIAFHAMVFWLFLFLYTMFGAELQEKFFFQKRLHQKNLGNKYLSFKNSYFVK